MKYICTECGKVFDEDEFIEEQEYRGEFWGSPAYETEAYSPCCHGGWDDYFPCCELCGSYENGVCSLKGEEVDTADLCKDYELSAEREYNGHI